MKTIQSIFLYGLCVRVVFASAGTDTATVTLPYSELLNLLERANSDQEEQIVETPKPPVDVVMQSALYRIDCTHEDAVTLNAQFDVVNLSDKWQSVFLVKASEAIRSLDPSDARIVEIDGGMSLLLEPMETASVSIGLQPEKPAYSKSGQLVADFLAVGAARSLLKIIHNEDPSAIVVTGAVGGNRDKTEFSLPASGGAVQVQLYKPEAIQPTVWSATATHVIRDLGGMIEVVCHLRLNPTDGGLTSRAKLKLASPATFLSITSFGTGASSHNSVEMSTEGPIVHLDWPHDGAMSREVMVKYSVPLEIVDARIAIPLLQVANAARLDISCYVSDFEGIEIEPRGDNWMEAGRPPDWIGQHDRMENFNFVTLSGEQYLDLSARILPRMKTASATILTAAYFTELVTDGGMLHRAEIVIDHMEQAAYVFKLPEGGKLLSCSLDGLSAEPFLKNNNELVINLPKANGSNSITKVGYVFTNRGAKMQPVDGRANLELPKTDLFAHKLSWEVQLPGEYEATALEGNVLIESGDSTGKAIRLSKQIFDNEAPFASLFYTRRDLQN